LAADERARNTGALVSIQILDGVAAGIFGVVSVLVIADLTQGSGRFNLTLGAIGTAVGIGASLSQVTAGSIVHHFGSNAGQSRRPRWASCTSSCRRPALSVKVQG
jgi:MFS family permease